MHNNKNKTDTNYSFGTLAVHAGEKPDPLTGAVAPVLVRSKTFSQPMFGEEAVWQYSRAKNPTRSQLQEKLAELEIGSLQCADDNKPQAFVYSSGLAAETMFFLTLDPGDHIILCQEVYGGTFRLLDQLFSRFGITFDFLDLADEQAVKKAVTPRTKYLFVETPTNPSLHIVDLEKINKLSKEVGVPWVADMTFSPPCTTRAFEYGAETVIHSISKYIAGHNDVLAGAAITRNPKVAEKLGFLQKTVGAILSPDECYRVLQGVKTLELRYRRVSETAQKVAEFLSTQNAIGRVLYPGLPSHPGYEIAKKQMTAGCGGVISFETKTTDLVALKKFVTALTDSGIIIYGESLASPETILAYPPLMSHKSLPKDVRQSLGIGDGFFRLSVGFEDPQDIIKSIENALPVL